MSAPFSYAQAASMAPVTTKAPITPGTSAKETTAVSPHGSTNSNPSSRAQSVRADPAEPPKAVMDTKQTTEISPEKTGSHVAAQDKISTAADESTTDSRPRSTTQDLSTTSSDRSSSAGQSGDARRCQKNQNMMDSLKDIKSEKENNDEKEIKLAPPVELTPAPLPTVNPWHRRAIISSNETAPIAEVAAEVIPTSKITPNVGEASQSKIIPRGSRGGDKDEKSTSAQVLPDDPRSWPTLPEGEEPKSSKPQVTKIIGSEGSTTSGKTKKLKWDKVELDHAAIYPSPIQRGGRGGRGGNRGGRDAGGRGASATSSGSGSTAPGAITKPSNEPKPRAREGSSGRNGGRTNNSPGGSRRVPAADAGPRTQSVAPAKDVVENFAANKTQQPKANAEASEHYAVGYGKYPVTAHTKETGQPMKEYAANGRDRENSRSERGGRGSYRGRGNHNGNTHGHSHSHSHSQQSFGASSGFNSNLALQGPFSPTGNAPTFNLGHGRGGGRGSNRGGYGRNSGSANGAPHSGVNGGASQRVMPIITDMHPSYNYANPQPPFSAPAVAAAPGFSQHPGIIIMLTRQIDYWFSPDNLVKDIWLRRNMDKDGFVLLKTIANFGRVKAMNASEDDLRYAIANSQLVDLWCAKDGLERIRLRGDSTPWIFPASERLPDGLLECVSPWIIHAQDFATHPPQWFQPTPNTAASSYYATQFPQPEANPAYGHHYNPHAQYPMVNGMNQQPGYSHGKPLTAEAPEFSPMDGAAPNGTNEAWAEQNGDHTTHVPNGASVNQTPNGIPSNQAQKGTAIDKGRVPA